MLLPLQFRIQTQEGLFPGKRVGAGRIPNMGMHPNCWGEPWAGTVLAIDDPLAWTGSIAFPGKPEQIEVSMHVRHCLTQGLLRGIVPVCWDFGKVFWERAETLRTVEADVAAFVAAREAARR